MTGRMMIAGVGNIFLGDDGFGVEVVARLAGAGLPDWVRVADYGINGLHLAYDLAEGYDTTVLVDASPRGDAPGTVYLMELDDSARPAPAAPGERGELTGMTCPDRRGRGIPVLDGHGMQPDVVFSMLEFLGADPGRVLMVGCEPASTDPGIGLSAPVAAAVEDAVRLVLDVVRAASEQEARDRGATSGGGQPTMKAWGGLIHVPWHTW